MNKEYGRLIIIGGAEDKSTHSNILNQVIRLSMEKEGPMVILTAATSYPEEVGFLYLKTFKEFGINNIRVIDVKSRGDANEEYMIKDIENCSCIFITGGDQLKVTSMIGGTKLGGAIKHAYENGTLIAGTSAGASCLSTNMMVSGKEESPPIKCTVKMAPGLDIIKGIIIDQHFSQRGRIGRLLNAVAHNPGILGIGIDENTAIIFDGKPVFTVIGDGSVTIIDGSSISYTDITDIRNDENISVFDAKLHILPEGCEFNIENRRPILQSTHEVKNNESN